MNFSSDSELRTYLRQRGTRLRDDLTAVDTQQSTAREQIAEILDELLAELEQLNLPGEQNRIPSGELWRPAAELLQTGWLQLRAREKPRGYAGDHELLQRICDYTICEHPLGQWFDHYFQAQTAPQAVRNRTQLVAERIVATMDRTNSGSVKIVSVGSGPAIDVRQACMRLSAAERERLDVILLDLDPAALEVATEGLAALLVPNQLQCVRENLFRLPKLKRAMELIANADLIACTGIFDYLPPADAAAMLRSFWQALAPGGQAVVFNFAPTNPTQGYMEWIGNWYLIYRGEPELRELIDATDLPPEQVQIGTEATGIDLYLELRK